MKKVHIKSAMPIYIAAAVWLLAGLVVPKALLRFPTLLIVALISCLTGFVSGRFFPGRIVEVREKIKTGDAMLDEEIEAGRLRLENLVKANDVIDHSDISLNLDRMTAAGEQVFSELATDKGKYSLVRRFMNYYLPTAEKLMEQYKTLMQAKVKGQNVVSAMTRIENSLGLIADAFEKCLDNLYKDQEMDIDAEIKVMKTMLAGDGLADNPGDNIHKKENSGITLTLGGK